MSDTSLVKQSFLAVADRIVRSDAAWREDLVHALERSIGADTVGYAGDVQAGMVGFSANVGGPPLSDYERQVWGSHHHEFPFFSMLLAGGEGCAERASDRLSQSQFRRTVVYAEHFRPRRSRYQANFGLVQNGHVAMVGIYRAARDFSAGEVAELEQGRTLLVRALQYRSAVDEFEALAEAADPVPTRSARDGLTARQREVLAMVATGATDRQVARQLGISERTVRKHLCDIRDRLHTEGRVAAAAWWLSHGAASSHR